MLITLKINTLILAAIYNMFADNNYEFTELLLQKGYFVNEINTQKKTP